MSNDSAVVSSSSYLSDFFIETFLSLCPSDNFLQISNTNEKQYTKDLTRVKVIFVMAAE